MIARRRNACKSGLTEARGRGSDVEEAFAAVINNPAAAADA